MATIDLSKVPSFYHNYIAQVKENDLENAFLKEIPEDQWMFRYAPGKWSVKELVQHIIDAERIFAYRALRFSRKDPTELPGFDENLYAPASKADHRTKEELIAELETVQKSSAQLFASFDEEQLHETGIANGSSVYVEAIGYIIVGHALHHKKVLSEKYLRDRQTL